MSTTAHAPTTGSTHDASSRRMQHLTRQECLTLLQEHHLGRLAFLETAGLMPLIIPVNYVLHGGAVVFRSDPGTKLTAAVLGAPVAFEVDGVNHADLTGWSVLVRARAEEVRDPAELEELGPLPLSSWAPGDKGHYVRIRPGQLSGRRISLQMLPSNWLG